MNASDHLEINILVGADYDWKVATGRIVYGRVGPTAIETRFGRVLSGPVPEGGLCSDKKLQMFWDLDTLGVREKKESVYDKFIRTV